MLGSKNKTETNGMTLNTIGIGTNIKGDINSNGDLRIDGNIDGNLSSEARVVIGAKSTINGDINAQNAIIEGTVNGNVFVKEILMLKSTAQVKGDIVMQKLAVENGAVFNGKSQMASALNTLKLSNKPIEEQ